MTTYLFEFLKKKSEENGFSYSALENKADLSHSVVQAIRNGRTQLKPATKQKLAQALGCSIGDIQDAIRRSDEVLEDGEVVRKKVYDKPVLEKEPEPHCPYDDPEEEPVEEPEESAEPDDYGFGNPATEDLTEEEKKLNNVNSMEELMKKQHPEGGLHMYNVKCAPKMPEKENPEKIGQKICVLGQVVPLEEPAETATQQLQLAVADKQAEDNVNHPAHYTQGAVECIDALEASMTPEEFRGYLKGCQMKYLWRYRMKGGLEDLQKARWYLDKLISKVEVDR